MTREYMILFAYVGLFISALAGIASSIYVIKRGY